MSEGPLRVTVLGGGAGGMTLAACAALGGHHVTLYSRSRSRVQAPEDIDLTGALTGQAVLAQVTDDLSTAVSDATLILVAVPAFVHEQLLPGLSGLAPDHSAVAFAPGNYGGLRFAHALQRVGRADQVCVAETSSLPFSVRRQASGALTVVRTKTKLVLGSTSAAAAELIRDLLAQALADRLPALQWELCPSMLEVNLRNVNSILHVPLSVLNAGALSRSLPSFDLLPDGLSPAVDALMARVDRERIAVATAVGLDLPTAAMTFRDAGFGHGTAPSTILSDVRMPEAPEARFPDRRLTEEVPYSLWPLLLLGAQYGVPLPATQALVTLAEVFMDRAGPAFPLADLGIMPSAAGMPE